MVYGLVVLTVALWPHHVDASISPGLHALLAHLRAVTGLPVTYPALEFAANVALFIPLAYTATAISPRHWWWGVALAGATVSVALELAQHTFLPGRVCDARDIAANTTGVLLGLLAARLSDHRQRPSSLATVTPLHSRLDVTSEAA